MNLETTWPDMVRKYIIALPQTDAAHDYNHNVRVTNNANNIIRELKESSNIEVDLDIVHAACMLHDIDQTPKDSPNRSVSSVLAAEQAVKFLKTTDFPVEKLGRVSRAIIKHSFSGSKESIYDPFTIEDSIVQDADRLDALGAIGIARMFYVAGTMKVPHFYYSGEGEFGLNDKKYVIDHVLLKLAKLPCLMKTEPGKRWANERYSKMQAFFKGLET